jgi:hypothetical protein
MEVENTEVLLTKDGTFKSLESIKEILPYGDDLMYLALYKEINKGQLTEDEIKDVDRDIFRLQQSYKTKLDNSINEQDRIAKERLLKE